MANNIFPNDINSALVCTVCLEMVLDDSRRSITKLICGHFFHTDCIGVEFNFKGIMICPNCRVIEEDGNWMRFAISEDEDEESNDEDEYKDEHPEDENRNVLRARIDAYHGSTSHMRHEMNINNDPWNDAPPNIRHTTLQTNNGCTIFSHTFVDESSILQQNEWTQQLHVPPLPIVLEMVDQRQISSLDSNVGSDSVKHETSTSYEQTCNNLLPCLELTLATTGTSRSNERSQPPCQCINCRAS